MRGWRALLLTLTLLSGCLGAADPADVETAADAASAASDAGAATRAPATDPPAGADDAAASPAPEVVVPLAFEGSLPPFVEPCASALVVGQCVAVSPGDFQNRFELAQDGNVSRAMLTLEWAASSPITENLGISFYSYGDPESVEHAGAFGPSPLSVEVPEAFVLAPGQTHEIVVFAGWTGAFALVAGAQVAVNPQEQPFTITGELVFPGPANP